MKRPELGDAFSYIRTRIAEEDRGHSSPCWIWQRARNSRGYGAAYRNGPILAHRLIHEVFKGLIPAGFQVDHLCRVKECVNPAHLEAVTPAENARRAAPFRPRITKTHCHLGHVRTPGRKNCQLCSNAQKVIYRARARAARAELAR